MSDLYKCVKKTLVRNLANLVQTIINQLALSAATEAICIKTTATRKIAQKDLTTKQKIISKFAKNVLQDVQIADHYPIVFNVTKAQDMFWMNINHER